jgi:hypothetical protein
MILTSAFYKLLYQEDEVCAQQFDHLIETNQTGSPSDGEVHTDHTPLSIVLVASPYRNKQRTLDVPLRNKTFTSTSSLIPVTHFQV